MSTPYGECCNSMGPGIFVVGSGVSHSFQEFAYLNFAKVGLDRQDRVIINTNLLKAQEIPVSQADPCKAPDWLGTHTQTRFDAPVDLLVGVERDRVASDQG
ncbi:hypothetical protein QH494_22390 [Sphingomonas sp. AR_OL41]|uniref:hypothetical protein n=1 Tax=Sphingomonas sp. AR_OL41 TaxID=3042729 RepID=UPI00248094CF|nr:hypothetical protein [Sphingomonas sp. AR_OL41]MDH7974945.1 hypothetical protein [Sphingomonas sp. AR_OL41]